MMTVLQYKEFVGYKRAVLNMLKNFESLKVDAQNMHYPLGVRYIDEAIQLLKELSVEHYYHVIRHDDDVITDFVIAENALIGFFVDMHLMNYSDGKFTFDKSSVYIHYFL